jgi:hypothetical protein
MPLDSANVPARRHLHFDTVDDALRGAERLAETDPQSHLAHVGNWTLGQTLGHLATWAEFCDTGTPLNPPFFVKLIFRFNKKQFLFSLMRSGVSIPRVPNDTVGTETLSLAPAIPRFERPFLRVRDEPPTARHSVLGNRTHAV